MANVFVVLTTDGLYKIGVDPKQPTLGSPALYSKASYRVLWRDARTALEPEAYTGCARYVFADWCKRNNV